MRKWVPESLLHTYAERTCHVIDVIKSHVPPCVQFAYINTIFNGWATSARFQQNDNVCYLCFECDGNDSIEHYAECRYMWGAFVRKSRVCCYPQNLITFLGLCADDTHEIVLHSCLVYAVREAVHQRRRSQAISGFECIGDLIWQGFRIASIHHNGLRRRIHSIWSTSQAT